MKKTVVAGSGVLFFVALSLTCMLSTVYVVPVAGRTEVAKASTTDRSRAEGANVPSFQSDDFDEDEKYASSSPSSSSSSLEEKRGASKRSKSFVANDMSASMTEMPKSSPTFVKPAIAGETSGLFNQIRQRRRNICRRKDCIRRR